MIYVKRAVLTGAIVCATSFAALAQDMFTADTLPAHEPDVENGKLVFNAAGCATCHAVDGKLDLVAGGERFSNKLGTLYAPNITDHTAGIGNWSDADFLNAVMRGQAPDGTDYISAFFPWPSYARMEVTDALDLRAYLKGLPQSDAMSKPREVNRIGRMAFRLQSDDRAPLTMAGDAQLQRGEYLVEALGHCGECHTPRKRFAMDLDRKFKGYQGYFKGHAPDISPERIAAIAPEAVINGVFVEGMKLNGRPIASKSMLRIVQATSTLSLDDRAAIYAYLAQVPVDASGIADVTPVQVAAATAGSTDQSAEVMSDKEVAAKLAAETGSQGLMDQVMAVCDVQDDLAITPAAPSKVAGSASVPAEIEQAADQAMDKSCRTCHGPGQRNEAVFAMHDVFDMGRDPKAVTPNDPDGSPLYASIAGGRMPIGSQMTPEEVDAIRNWIIALGQAGAAQAQSGVSNDAEQSDVGGAAQMTMDDLPKFAGGDFAQLMLATATDLGDISERDRPYIRYLSFANTPLPQIDCDAPAEHRNPMRFLHAGLNKFINSVSRARTLASVTPVEGTGGALVRIDIRDYGWDVEDWRALSEGVHTVGAELAGFSATAWEDLAEVNPYAVDPHSDPFLAVISKGTQTAVPILNADWFTHFGASSPYYDMLLRLSGDIRDIESGIGIDVDREIQNVNMARSGFRESGGERSQSYVRALRFGKRRVLLEVL